jgi:peptidoglycan/LPS O-acetylase OafA/YrhL
MARFWQFALGCALANLYVNRPQRLTSSLVRLGPGTALVALFAVHAANSFLVAPHINGSFSAHYPLTLEVFAIFGGFLVYASSSRPWTPTSRFLGSSLMARCGDVSYASYLLHAWILEQVNAYLFYPYLAPQASGLAGVLQVGRVLATWIAILALSYAVFVLFEAPARRWIRANLNPNLVVVIISLQLALFAGGVFVVTVIHRTTW